MQLTLVKLLSNVCGSYRCKLNKIKRKAHNYNNNNVKFNNFITSITS